MVAWKSWFTTPTVPSPRLSFRTRHADRGRWRYIEALEDRMMMAGAATQLVFTVQPSQVAALTPMFPSIQVTVEDALGATVTTDTSNITLIISSNPGGGGFAGGSTVTVKASGGVANFTNVSFSVVGSYTISAGNGTLGTPLPSNIFTVTPAATQLAFTQAPTDVTAGSPFGSSISVAVEDSNGNLVTTDRSNVTLLIASGPNGGTITGTKTVTAVNGVATFNGITLPKSGSYQLAVKDGTLASSTSSTFTVSAGAAASLGFGTQPVNTPGSATVTPAVTVNVLDAFGNIVTNDSSLVTLAINTGPGVITGTTAASAVNGVATFNNISFPTFGVYTLKATDGSLSQSVSNSFAVIGPPALLAFQRQPSQATVGSPITPSILIAVEDASGNIVTNATSSITMTVLTGPGSLSGTTTVPVVNGIATFSDLSLSLLGTYTLNAAGDLLTNVVSSAFLINGLPTQLAFGSQPTGSAAGDRLPHSVTVKIEDSAGNTVVADTSLVTISVGTGPGGSSISGTTSVSAVNGVATFNNLIPSIEGTYTLAAADGILTGATSLSFIVTPPPSHVEIVVQPTTVAATSPSPNIVVDVKNALGAIVTTNGSAVTLQLVSGPSGGSMNGATTVNAINGVATFSGLSFSKPGTYQFVAFDGALATDTSSLFTVTGPPTKLVFLNQPQSKFIAGVDTYPNFIVAVRDANGNTVTTDTSTISLPGSWDNGTNPRLTTLTAVAVNGIANFSSGIFTPTIAGNNFVVTATDGALTAATSNTYSVVADLSSAHLKFISGPSNSLVGTKLSANVVLNVVDGEGNIITTDNSTVLLTVFSGPGTISGTASVKASKGVVTFNNLILSQAGTYTLLATDPHFTSPSPVANGTLSFSTIIAPAIITIPNFKVTNPYAFGKTITLTDTFKNLVATPVPFTGTTTLLDDSNNVLASSTVNAAGATKFTITNFTAGSYVLHIVYSGDNNHTGGQSADVNLTVALDSTTTTITPSATNLLNGQTLTLSTLVKTISGVTAPRTGTVVIRDGGIPIIGGTLTLSSSAASLAFVPTIGTHHYSIIYAGDSNFLGSLSLVSTVKVT